MSSRQSDEVFDRLNYLTSLFKGNGINDDVKKPVLEFAQKVIVQLKDELPQDMNEIILHIGGKNLGYKCYEHYDMGKNGKPIKGLDLRLPED